jgi:Kinetochore Sim4 complex subunit FTA2
MAQAVQTTLIDLNEPLPRCEGPKLRPFKDRKANIKFVSLLSRGDGDSDSDSDSSSGGHGHVFEVIIASRRYALKIVSGHLQFKVIY